MTTKALEQAKELEAKAKAIRRQEKAFWNDIKEREDEVREFLGVGQAVPVTEPEELIRLRDIAGLYGTSIQGLLDYISSDRQVQYYRNSH